MSGAKARIAAVGAGRMGRGLAHVFAHAGHEVALIDVKERAPKDARRLADDARGEVEATIAAMTEFGVQTADQGAAALARISYHGPATAEAALAEADFVFEAVPELLDVKRAALGMIGAAARSDAIVASTTSTMMVDELAGLIAGPERFLNGHWLNPAFLIPLVEVSPGAATARETVAAFMALLEGVGKVPVKCAATPGFIVPRIQALAMSEVARMVDEGVASAADIDRATRVGFGIRFAILGLVEFIDWGGLDTLYYANRYMTDALGAERFASPPVVERLMEEGRIGPKSGRGFYDYRDMDVAAYQRETLGKLVDLLSHLGLIAPPGGVADGAASPASRTRTALRT